MAKTIKIPIEVDITGDKQALNDLAKIAEAAKQAAKDFDRLNDEMKQSAQGAEKAFDNMGKSANLFSSAIANMGKVLGALAIVDIIRTIGETFRDATLEAERFQTLLTSAFLGDVKKAQQALKALNEIAAQTPYSLSQVTESYVRLVNRGLKPTREQFLNLGNVAAKVGKDMNQLTEAILDAQQGEKERLKEFGIQMKTNGKQIELQLGKTKVVGEGMVETFAKLGSMPGFSDALISQSQTLSGQWSTFKDTIMVAFAQLGNNSTVMNAARDGLKVLNAGVSVLIKGFTELATFVQSTLFPIFQPLVDRFREFVHWLSESTTIADYFRGVWDVVKQALAAASEIFVTLLSNIYDLGKALFGIADSSPEFVSAFNSMLNGVLKFAAGTIAAILEVNRAFRGLGQTITALISGEFSKAANIFGNIGKGSFTNVAKAIAGAGMRKAGATTVKPQGRTDFPEFEDSGYGKATADKAKSEKAKELAVKEARDILKAQFDARNQELELQRAKEQITAEQYNMQRFENEQKYVADAEVLAKQLIVDNPAKFRARNADEERAWQREQADMQHKFRMLLAEQDKKDLELFLKEQEKWHKKQLDLINDNEKAQIELQKQIDKNAETSVFVANENILQIEKNAQEQRIAQEKIFQEIQIKNGKEYTGNLDQLLKARAEMEVKSELNRQALLQATRERNKQLAKERISGVASSISGLGPIGEGIGSAINTAAKAQEDVANINKEIEQTKKEIEEFGDETGELQKKLDALNMKKANTNIAAGLAITKDLINGIVGLINQIQQAQIANIDAEIERRKANIESIKEETQARLAQIETNNAIDKKLAEIRIKELEHLRTQVPEAAKAKVDKDIQFEKDRVKGVEKERKKEEDAAKKRLKDEEQAVKDLEEEKRKIQEENFEINRAATIANIIIQGTLAAIQAFSSLAAIPVAGPALGTAAAIAVGALTAVQVGIAAAQPNPYAKKLAKGTLSVEGGISGQDSVPALLMPGEAVIPTDRAQAYEDTLAAIYFNKIPAPILEDFVTHYQLRKQTSYKGGNTNIATDPKAITDPIVSAIRQKEHTTLNIDKNGIEIFIESANTRTRVMDRKLRKTS